MANKKNVELKRVNINLPLSLVDRIKDYSNSIGLNVTSTYIVLLNQALEQKNFITNSINSKDKSDKLDSTFYAN